MAGLSSEGRFQLAYSAALDLATVAVLAFGYRVKTRIGHHELTFEAAGLAVGKEAGAAVHYFDVCRRRRNDIAYEGSEIGEEFANELLQETSHFLVLVEGWLRRNHSELLRR